MKITFVADGYLRYLRGKRAVSWESVQKKHAGELAAASPVQKLRIHKEMAREFLSQKKLGHKPSPESLW